MPLAPTAALSDCFDLDLSGGRTEKLGLLHAFGRYWVWNNVYPAGPPALELYEWTPQGIADLTTAHDSFHVVKAGTPFQVAGLFGYWLTTDGDTHWLQLPREDKQYFAMVAGGRTALFGEHFLSWYCPECGSQLGEQVRLRHQGTPAAFLEAQRQTVDAFNGDLARRICAGCGTVHPEAYPFRVPAAGVQTIPNSEFPPPHRRVGPDEALARLDELGEGTPLVVDNGSQQITLVRVDGQIHAFANLCPHSRGPLGHGPVRHGEIVCPWHFFRFDVATGKSATGDLRLRQYRVDVRDGAIYLA